MVRIIARIRYDCLRKIDQTSPLRTQLFDSISVRRLPVAQKFLFDAIEDGYVTCSPADQHYRLTKDGRRLLYELDRRIAETVQYAITTLIALAALVVSILF